MLRLHLILSLSAFLVRDDDDAFFLDTPSYKERAKFENYQGGHEVPICTQQIQISTATQRVKPLLSGQRVNAFALRWREKIQTHTW